MKFCFKSLLILLTMVGFSDLNAQNEVNQPGPQMTFESTTVDYGKIEQGSDGIRNFKFTNTGDQPLIITNARGSCGCTVPSYPSHAIMPGESEVIEVKYDTNRLGNINKTVTITSNTGDPVVLRIAGEVLKAERS